MARIFITGATYDIAQIALLMNNVNASIHLYL